MKDTTTWRNVRGYGGKYQVSYFGEVRRVFPSGKTRLMTPYKRSENSRARKKITRNRLYVKLTDDEGRGREVPMLKLMATHFLPEPKPGEVPYHINGIVTDNYVSNIGYIDRKELGKLTGHISKSQQVVKIDDTGHIVEAYRSAREAAKHCFMSYQTIIDRCNGQYKKGGKVHYFKSIFAPDGFIYAWDTDRNIKKVLEQLKEETKDKPVVIDMGGYYIEEETTLQSAGLDWKEVI